MLTRLVLFFAAFVLAVLALHTLAMVRDVMPQPDPATCTPTGKPLAIARVWEYPAGQYASMKLIFEPGGRLQFEGGYEFWNPAEWRYDEATCELWVTIKKIDNSALSVFDEHVKKGWLKRVDRKKKAIVYHLGPRTNDLVFQGFHFFKKTE